MLSKPEHDGETEGMVYREYMEIETAKEISEQNVETNMDENSIEGCEEDGDVQNKMKKSILDSVAHSDGFFKSQQIGEKDLTFFEKREIAADLLENNLPVFLQRYWKFIKSNDVQFFDQYQENYEVNFYVSEMCKFHNSRKSKVCIRNRRYEALKQMVDKGSYFSENEMKKRSPFLFEQFIGKHMTENEKIAAYKEQHKNDTFATFLMDQMERNVENQLYKDQKEEDEAIIEEEDDDTEEESELEDDVPAPSQQSTITDEERALLRAEFTNIMYENFLAGKDAGFDYSSVDDNVEYDSVQQRDIDEEEKYFDDDED